jgi:hypothetical protein
MTARIALGLFLVAAMVSLALPAPVPGCCAVYPSGKPVVNADQTVLIIWDAENKTEHFIRQASFKSDTDDFGFLVPTPSQPELSESGNEAFPVLRKLTEPEHKKMPRPSRGGGMACGCGDVKFADMAVTGSIPPVVVLDEKRVAGFDAVVLEAQSADALVGWLKERGYNFSPEVQAWAKPYIDQGWKITALKVAPKEKKDDDKTVAAGSLRISFKTDRPLFPYREPDSTKDAASLGARHRLLRIYFIGEARYQGELTKENPWTGTVAFSNKLTTEDRKKLLEHLKLPEKTGPADWWLTEFEDNWPYKVAPADVYFSRDTNQEPVKRPPIIDYVSSPWPSDVTVVAIGAALVLPSVWRRVGRRRGVAGS